MWTDTPKFLARFLRHPMRVGAVAPSSAALAAQAIAPVPGLGDPVVVELGPGTGTFTKAIQERLGGRGRHVVVEIDEVFAKVLRRRFRRVEVVVADAARLPQLLAPLGLSGVDAVVSGLPWAAYTSSQRACTLDSIVSVMAPHAGFTTFAYRHTLWAPPARRLAADLRCTFDEVVVGRTVWANMPPALVYHARRPHISAD
jgi:phosphatidylethanolamine/phosphatidyl-N-methylethanolamine N-methyltransferase